MRPIPIHPVRTGGSWAGNICLLVAIVLMAMALVDAM